MGKSLFSKIMSKSEDEVEDIIETTPAAEEETAPVSPEGPEDDQWLADNNEGELSVDVFQSDEHVVIKSTIAGVKPEDIDIAIDNDMITIRGERSQEETVQEDDYFYQECYWGAFSRSIILPVEVKSEEVQASLKNGVLTVKLPKAKKSKSVSVKVNTE